MNFQNKCSISVISHGQIDLVKELLEDLEDYNFYIKEIIVTINIPETLEVNLFRNNIILRTNKNPKGFGANHNAAFKNANGEYFFVLNPDLRIKNFNFETFLEKLSKTEIGVLSPSVEDKYGNIEDHFREFPSIKNILCRLLNINSYKNKINLSDYSTPEMRWIAGMFMAFRNNIFRKISGFDERYFMYLEDVDICKKVNVIGKDIRIDPSNKVMHDAQRGSHKNFKLFLIHCSSYIKYFIKWFLR